MIRAVGGEFELDPALLRANDAPPLGGCYFSSGRAALFAILAKLGTEHYRLEVLLPRWICESVVATADDTSLPLRFYPLADGLLPDVDAIADLASQTQDAAVAIVVVDYFGLAGVETAVAELKRRLPEAVVIVDDVQAFFEMGTPTSADYRFTSFRKTLPAPDGALVEASAGDFLQPRLDRHPGWAYEKALGALLKSYSADLEGDHVFLDFLDAAEEELDHEGYYDAQVSDVSRRVIANLDLADIARRRVENFRTLEAALAPLGLSPILPMRDDAVPLYLPLLLEDRDTARAFLAENRIFAPVHWPLPARHRAELDPGGELWAAELSLPIDQRYGADDMDLIADALGRCRARALHH